MSAWRRADHVLPKFVLRDMREMLGFVSIADCLAPRISPSTGSLHRRVIVLKMRWRSLPASVATQRRIAGGHAVQRNPRLRVIRRAADVILAAPSS